MWPDSPFAEPRGSFLRPVLPPTSGPDSTPTRTIEVNCSWQVWIRGALQQLLLQSTWAGVTGDDLLQIQQWVYQLIDMFDECADQPLPFACPYQFEFSQGPWFPPIKDSRFSPTTFGTYVAGEGWETTPFTISTSPGEHFAWANCGFLTSPFSVSRIEMVYDLTKGDMSLGHANNTDIELYLSGSLVTSVSTDSATDPDGTGKTLVWTGSETIDGIFCVVETQHSYAVGPSGVGIIKEIIINGSGQPIC